MIQHTMQEIADFIGKNVAKDKNGSVYVFGSIPHKQSTFWFGSNYCNITDVVSDAAAHDWTVLVEPYKDYTCPNCGKPLNVTVKKGTCEPICDKCGGRINEELFNEIIEQGR